MNRSLENLKKLVKGKNKPKYIGSFDVFQDNSFQGWVYNQKDVNEIIVVEIYFNDTFILQGKNTVYRQDLKDNNIGTGRHGFNIKIDKSTKERLTKSEGKFSIYVKGKEFLLGEVKADGASDFSWTENQTKFITEFLKPQWTKILLDFSENSTRVVQKRSGITWEDALFDGDKSFPYLTYSAHRMKRLSQSTFELNKIQFDTQIEWYLSVLQNQRFPLRLPVSKYVIDYLNEPIEFFNTKNSISRHSMYYLQSNREQLQNWEINNENWFLNFIFGYVTNILDKNLGDILLPESYVNKLRKVSLEWKGDDFAISLYLERYFFYSPHLHFIDLRDKNSRILYLIFTLGRAVEKPELLKFVPRKTVENLFKESDKKSWINACLFEMYNETSLENYINKNRLELSDFETILYNNGYSLQHNKSIQITNKGNRLFHSPVETELNTDKYDVQVIGPFEKASGLGQACRMTASILENTKYKVAKYNFDLDNPAPVGYNDVDEDFEQLYSNVPINLIHLNAESIPLAYAYLPDVYSDSYNIGYFYWELNSPASCHYLSLNLLDEIWVATDYGVSIYESNFKNDVVNVGMIAEDIPKSDPNDARDFLKSIVNVNDKSFVFLTVFDSFSFIQRKNPLGVIKAFQRAFTNGQDVNLILKTQNRDFVFDHAQEKMWNNIYELTDNDNRIHIINETFTYKNLLKFKQASDCYVSLHKSEGWGFGMIEAMQIGVPVICTDYSGNLDFCNDENVMLVDYENEYLNADDYIFVRPGQYWANPSIDSASQAMKKIYQNEELRNKLSINAQAFVRNNFSMDQIANRFENRISEIFKNKIVL